MLLRDDPIHEYWNSEAHHLFFSWTIPLCSEPHHSRSINSKSMSVQFRLYLDKGTSHKAIPAMATGYHCFSRIFYNPRKYMGHELKWVWIHLSSHSVRSIKHWSVHCIQRWEPWECVPFRQVLTAHHDLPPLHWLKHIKGSSWTEIRCEQNIV